MPPRVLASRFPTAVQLHPIAAVNTPVISTSDGDESCRNYQLFTAAILCRNRNANNVHGGPGVQRADRVRAAASSAGDCNCYSY